jgi:hypothetical protein
MSPPTPNPLGSFWLGFWLAWGALFGGYTLVVSFLASIANMVRGGGVPDEVWIFLAFCPWLLILALIVWFAAQGKTRTAKGVAVGLASIVGIGVLLFAACFTLLSGPFH